MGNKINKECNEECKGYTNDAIFKKIDKKFKDTKFSHKIDKKEYDELSSKQSILTDDFGDLVDSLKNRFSNDKEKLCELLCDTSCLVKRQNMAKEYYKTCLQTAKVKDLDKDLPAPKPNDLSLLFLDDGLSPSETHKKFKNDDHISLYKSVKRLQKSKKTVKTVKTVKKVKTVKSRTR